MQFRPLIPQSFWDDWGRKDQEEEAKRTVYVTNLSEDASEDLVFETFSTVAKVGRVCSPGLAHDRSTLAWLRLCDIRDSRRRNESDDCAQRQEGWRSRVLPSVACRFRICALFFVQIQAERSQSGEFFGDSQHLNRSKRFEACSRENGQQESRPRRFESFCSCCCFRQNQA